MDVDWSESAAVVVSVFVLCSDRQKRKGRAKTIGKLDEEGSERVGREGEIVHHVMT
jgi:hypothetical protein